MAKNSELKNVENPLKQLFGFGKENPITRKDFLETRKLLENKIIKIRRRCPTPH